VWDSQGRRVNMSSRPPLIAAFAGLDPRGLLESSNEGDTALGCD